MFISNSVTPYPTASDFISDIRWLIQLDTYCPENHYFLKKTKLSKCAKPSQHPYLLLKYLYFLNLKVVDCGCSWGEDRGCGADDWAALSLRSVATGQDRLLGWLFPGRNPVSLPESLWLQQQNVGGCELAPFPPSNSLFQFIPCLTHSPVLWKGKRKSPILQPQSDKNSLSEGWYCFTLAFKGGCEVGVGGGGLGS